MKVIVAPDKFKGSLTAHEAAQAIAEGVRQAFPDAEIVLCPMADGGEGTLALLLEQTHGIKHEVRVLDPLGREVSAAIGFSQTGQWAFIEMAQASGVQLLTPEEQNPRFTSTYGTGQLIRSAIERGASQILMGLGGSATNDGGMGMATALGWTFWDEQGHLLQPSGAALSKIAAVSDADVPKHLKSLNLMAACDVTNPLYGPNGAAHVFASQKGAKNKDLKTLDDGLRNLAAVLERFGYCSDLEAQVPGSGAAGGLGFGLRVFCGAKLQSGMDVLMQYAKIHDHLQTADVLITGEGKIDHQTSFGKVVHKLAEAAQKQDVPVIALCGTLDLNPIQIRGLGLAYAASILPRPMSLEEAQRGATTFLAQHTTQVIQLFYLTPFFR